MKQRCVSMVRACTAGSPDLILTIASDKTTVIWLDNQIVASYHSTDHARQPIGLDLSTQPCLLELTNTLDGASHDPVNNPAGPSWRLGPASTEGANGDDVALRPRTSAE
jgi:hypothetical protein